MSTVRSLVPRIWIALAALSPLACEGPPAEVAAEVETLSHALTLYPLVCRGGASGGIQFIEQNLSSGTRSDLHFDRSWVAGQSQSSMPLGSCAWQDRPLAASEPNRICIDGPQLYWVVRSNDQQPAALVQLVQSAWDPNFNKMTELLSSDGNMFRTFMVRNDFAGCLRTQ